jgi:hypothetical protein
MPSAPTRKEAAWSENDEERLLQLIGETSQRANAILLELHSEPEFANLSMRKQAKLFSAKAGNGIYGALLHLARLNQLNSMSARKVLKSPETLSALLRTLGIM